MRVRKNKNFPLILLCFVFAYLGAALPAAAQTKNENRAISLDVIASIPIINPTNETLTLSVIVPAAFLLTKSVAIDDDDYDGPGCTVTGIEKYLSFVGPLSIHPVFTVFTKENSTGLLTLHGPRPPPFL